MNIGVLLISTGQYKQFVPSLLKDIEEKFLLNHNITVYLFTDVLWQESLDLGRVQVVQDLIVSYKFPYASLYRYAIFTSRKYPNCDYLYYMDVDVAIADEIGDEILDKLVAVRHCGFYRMGGGSWETRPESTAFVYPEDRVYYYAGGFQGGHVDYFYRAMQQMKRDIDEDERNGIIPIWHDESIWNAFLSRTKEFKRLHSGYCLVEEKHLRQKWNVDDLPVKLIALAKDHKKIRE